MSATPQKKDSTEDVLRLRDAFAARARQAQDTARDLEEQARQKRQEAENMTRQALVLHQAYELLQQEKNDNMLSRTLDDLSAKDLAKLAKRQFIFLIDGSGSMQGAPLNGTLKSAQAFAQKIVDAGGQVESMMFGNQTPIRFDVLNKEVCDQLVKGLNSGTDLAPSLHALSQVVDKRKAAHVVVFSDGDMFDAEASARAAQMLAAQFPKLTFDAIQITGNNGSYLNQPPRSYSVHESLAYFNALTKPKPRAQTAMAKLFDTLSTMPLGGHSVNCADATENNAVEVLGGLIAKRLAEKTPKPAAKPKAPKAPGN